MRDIIKKILRESEEFEWVPDLIKVVVTNTGDYYPTNLDAMIELGVIGAREFLEKYGSHWWLHRYSGKDDVYFLMDSGVNLTFPIKDKIYYTTDKYYLQNQSKIYKLMDPDTNKEFVMREEGFKRL